MHLLRMLMAYWATKRMQFSTREALEAHQAKQLDRFLKRVAKRSHYFSSFRGLPLTEWPTMDKSRMLHHFNQMNTAGLSLQTVFETALRCEKHRDFKPKVNGITVGLSSGTSFHRGVFAVNAHEQARWAGIMLAKTLPDGLFAGERVALFLRANSNLYQSVESPWLSFVYFDLFQNFEKTLVSLVDYQPSIIVAPAQVLRQLAIYVLEKKLNLSPKKVISVAEVLEVADKTVIEQAFGRVHEIYQATEGFLASTCKEGVLHLNEEYLIVEPQWLDDEKVRFTPWITDFSRITQPIIRYRLDDILIARNSACACGSHAMALQQIEGRCDDAFVLTGLQGKLITVFSDLLSRALAHSLPLTADYRLIQWSKRRLGLFANVGLDQLIEVRNHLNTTLESVGVDTHLILWSVSQEIPEMDVMQKRRRIMRYQKNNQHLALDPIAGRAV
jgi:putative adenylate-forming enzyme